MSADVFVIEEVCKTVKAADNRALKFPTIILKSSFRGMNPKPYIKKHSSNVVSPSDITHFFNVNFASLNKIKRFLKIHLMTSNKIVDIMTEYITWK